MSTLDFDTLRVLAERDEAALDALLQQELESLLASANPESSRRLRGLQFQIDCQKRLARNPVDRCVRLSRMLHARFNELQEALQHLLAGDDAALNAHRCEVVTLARHRRVQKKRPT